MAVKNQVQLITYPDSLGGNLAALNLILDKYFPNTFKGGIHILPPFPSSGDRGFAPLTYFEIEPQFGSWEDIQRIGEKHDILIDLMVNHISAKSSYFQDFLLHGRKSAYADLFISIDKIWPDGNPPQADIEKIFLRRIEPFSEFSIKETNQVEKIWTTFGKVTPSEQIDLDVNSDTTRRLFADFLFNFKKNKVKIVRLDAIGYVIKKPGTSCFFVEPEIYNFLDWIAELANSLEIEILPEVHAHYTTQLKLAARGHWIYDFILPYTILDALINKTSVRLYQYLENRPHKQFTMLDCHDGVPIKPDMNDLYKSEDVHKLVDICLRRGANLSLIFSPEHKDSDGFDVHQIRGAYYSLLDCNDDAYMAARAIQFFVPGVPQVYYVGLLAGKNDDEGVRQQRDGREINRHNFSLQEIEQAVKQDVVQRLLQLIRFRNDYSAFQGKFMIIDSDIDELRLSWQKDNDSCTLKIDLNNYQTVINYIDERGKPLIYVV